MTPIKIAATVISVGGVAVGSGFGIHHLTKEKTVQTTTNIDDSKVDQRQVVTASTSFAISTLLTENKLKLLGDEPGDAEKWTESWGRFKKAYESEAPKAPWNFTDWTRDKEGSGVPQEFKTRCSENSKQSVPSKEDDLFKAIKDYCTEANGELT